MTPSLPRTAVDLHLHSSASNTTDYYVANAFGIPESHSDPLALHPLLVRRGMRLITLSDHNTIDGVLRMMDAGLPDVFISAELTTTFPEDGCNIHVVVMNVTEAQFREANRLRTNLYDLLAYLDQQIAVEHEQTPNRLGYFMAHPLMSTQNRPYGRAGALGLSHIEKAILLFNTFEVRNGARTRALNELTEQLLSSLTPEAIERLACRHSLAPKGETPWLKAFVGGSDDHSGINPGHTWTQCVDLPHGALTPNALVEAMRQRRTRPGGTHGGPITLAHSLIKLAFDGSRQRPTSSGARRPALVDGPMHHLLELVFEPDPVGLTNRLRRKARWVSRSMARRWAARRSVGTPFERVLEAEVATLIATPGFRETLGNVPASDDRIFMVVSALVSRIFAHYVSSLKQRSGLTLIAALKELIALAASHVFVSLPYLIAFFHQASDSMISRDVRAAFRLRQGSRLALVTDTFFDINGVSLTIRRMIHEAERRNIPFQVMTCLTAEEQTRVAADPEAAAFVASGRVKVFTAIASVDCPEYDGLQIRFPPVLELLKHLQQEGFTKVQISTPGTVGLGGLLAAKILQLETAATYHTCFPEYVENYTKDLSLETLAWKYMVAFYHATDEVVVPSRFVAKLLHKRGLRKKKLLILDRWVDVERFHPRNREPGFWADYGVTEDPRVTKFIYVGRLGVEKNLQVVAAAYRRVRAERADAHLILVGDGPFRAELEKSLSGLPVTFTGFLEGASLARAVASADVKLFPSTTDTWGNAPLEAQASGLPVIVANAGGPPELVLDGITGLKVDGADVESFVGAMRLLMNQELRLDMGAKARAFAEANDVRDPFSAILDSEGYRERLAEQQAAEPENGLRLPIAPIDLLHADTEGDHSLAGALFG